MLKKNKWKLLISSLMVLAPMAAGALTWHHLPDDMMVQWNGTASQGAKVFAVFGLPLVLLAIHWLCILITAKDPKNHEQHPKVISMVMWIIPITSLFVSGLVYFISTREVMTAMRLLPIFLGVLFVVIGNYLPKCKSNFIVGIRVRWTLINEDNWRETHRIGGKVWVIAGLAMLLLTFLPMTLMMTGIAVVTVAAVLVPVVFSYRMYRRQLKNDEVSKDAKIPLTQNAKKWRIIAIVFTLVILAAVAVLMFTGDVAVVCGENTFTIEASYYTDLTVVYDDIVWVNYYEGFDVGMRVNGFGSARLQMGTFENEEFGTYTLYAYTDSDSYAVISSDDEVLVVGLESAAKTKALYDTLVLKITQG